MKLKNIDEIPVIVGFSANFQSLQANSQASKIQLYDAIIGVNNVDIRTQNASSSAGCSRKRRREQKDKADNSSNFCKLINAIRATAESDGNGNNAFVNPSNVICSSQPPSSISISLSTIDSSIVCITLARSLRKIEPL